MNGALETTKPRIRRFYYGYVILFFGLLTLVGTHGFGRYAYTPIAPAMKDGLRLSYAEVGLLTTGNFVGYTAAALVGGYLASRYGPRKVIVSSMMLIAGSMLLTGLASGLEMAVIGRILTGIGSAGACVPTTALVSSWFASRRRGLATGAVVSGASFGTMISGWMVPMVITSFAPDGWRYAWYILGAGVFVFGVLGLAFLREADSHRAARTVRVYGPSGTYRQTRTAGRSSHSELDWSGVYRSRALWVLAIVYATFGLSQAVYTTFYATYLQKVGGLGANETGHMFSLLGFLSLGSAYIWGAVSDVIGRKAGLAIVLSLQVVALLTMAFGKSVPAYYVSTVVYGTVAFSVPTIMGAVAGDHAGPRLAAAALGFLTTIFGIASALGPYIGGKLIDQSGSFEPTFVLAAIVALAGVLISMTIRRPAAVSG